LYRSEHRLNSKITEAGVASRPTNQLRQPNPPSRQYARRADVDIRPSRTGHPISDRRTQLCNKALMRLNEHHIAMLLTFAVQDLGA
jgi:hypothetical protein